jgi:putative glutamine amidotransferase
MHPIIGIIASAKDVGDVSAPTTYTAAIEGAGGVPVILPCGDNFDMYDHFLDLCDGFMFTGGCDIHPARYGEQTLPACGSIQDHRDIIELAFFEKAIKIDKPIIAICRGIQVVNVALGGTLYQDIPSQLETDILHKQTQERCEPSHSVTVVENTPLHAMTGGKTTIVANSFHHQAIKALGRGLEVMARAQDGVIEAVFMPEKKHVRAYQWHPERLWRIDTDNQSIFAQFVDACRNEG